MNRKNLIRKDDYLEEKKEYLKEKTESLARPSKTLKSQLFNMSKQSEVEFIRASNVLL